MTRIVCKTPSVAKPTIIAATNIPTAWTTVAEAPDFSVPDSRTVYPVRDPLDASRGIRPGELFLLTPLKARNKTGTAAWIEARIVFENATELLLDRIEIPANETFQIVVQGFSLLKRVAGGTNGDRLQLRAGTSNTFDVVGRGDERASTEHVGVEV